MRKKKKVLLVSLMMMLIIGSFTGCSSGGDTTSSSIGTSNTYGDYKNDTAGESVDSSALADVNEISADEQNTDVKKNDDKTTSKKIYKGSIEIETVKYNDVYESLHALADVYDAYFESDNIDSTSSYFGDKAYAQSHMTIRIPVENFQLFMNQVEDEKNVIIKNKSINVDDVSEVYYDVENRIENCQLKIDKLQALLKKATSVSDMIAIENAINDAEYELESLTGQLKQYDSQVAYSTINISLCEVPALSLSTKSVGYGNKLVAGFKSGFVKGVTFLSEVLLWIVSNWLIIIIVVLIVVYVLHTKKKSGRRKKKNRNKNKNKISDTFHDMY